LTKQSTEARESFPRKRKRNNAKEDVKGEKTRKHKFNNDWGVKEPMCEQGDVVGNKIYRKKVTRCGTGRDKSNELGDKKQ